MNTKPIVKQCIRVLFLALAAVVLVSGCNSASTYTPPPQQIYVTQGSNVEVFPLTANGDAAPTATITNATTPFYDAHRTAFDSSGNIYVTDAGSGAVPPTVPASVPVFAAGATGSATPTTTITGPATELGYALGIAFDSKGNLYVTSLGTGNQGPALVAVFAAGSSGNAAPTTTISGAATTINTPNGIAFDSKGNLYLADEYSATVLVFAAGATGNTAPIATITGFNRPHAVALDSSDNLYVTDGSVPGSLGAVDVFAYGANGAATPIATIAGAATGISNPNGIALDAKDNIYVANAGIPSVTVYAAGTNGNTAPTATITGTNTGLSRLHGISIH